MTLNQLIKLLEAVREKHDGDLVVHSQDADVAMWWNTKDFSVKVRTDSLGSCHLYAGPEGSRFKGWHNRFMPVQHETFTLGKENEILIVKELL